jgi:hypothetical protein
MVGRRFQVLKTKARFDHFSLLSHGKPSGKYWIKMFSQMDYGGV